MSDIKSDREALLYLMQQFDAETWQCPSCGHAEDTATMDSAYFLRDYLKQTPEQTPASLDEALNVIEHWAMRGNTLQGDDVERLHALVDKIAPREREVPDVDASRWRTARDNEGDGLRIIMWDHKQPDELQVMFPSPTLCDSYADAAILAAAPRVTK